MKNATLKVKILSLVLMLTMLVGMTPLSGIVSYATGAEELQEIQNESTEQTEVRLDTLYVDITALIEEGKEVDGVWMWSGPNTVFYNRQMIHVNENVFLVDVSDAVVGGETSFSFAVHFTDGTSTSMNYTYDIEAGKNFWVASDSYDGFWSVYEGNADEEDTKPFDTVGTATLNEEMTVDLFSGNQNMVYVAFTPAVSKEYIIEAIESEGDPVLYLYNSNGISVGQSDDVNGRLFRLVISLVGGVTYYLGIYDFSSNLPATIIVREACDEHTPGNVDCLGITCSVCGEIYGEGNGVHDLGEKTCSGQACSVCSEYYGEVEPDSHIGMGDGSCDLCSYFEPNVVGSVSVGVRTTIDLPISYNSYFVTFVPETSGEYVIESFDFLLSYDPAIKVRSSDGEELGSNDDFNNYQFKIKLYFEAGETYYLGIYDRENNRKCNFSVTPFCAEHVPSDTVDCRGITCSVCGATYGEGNEEHSADGDNPATCAGVWCDLCHDYFGEADPAGHVGLEDGFCDLCNVFVATNEISITVTAGVKATIDLPKAFEIYYAKFVPKVSGTYYIKSFASEFSYDPYLYVFAQDSNQIGANHDYNGYHFYLEIALEAGKIYFLGIGDQYNDSQCSFVVNLLCDEHTPSDEVNCLGTVCDVCDLPYGEGNDQHALDGEATCLGTLCSLCGEYFGETVDHTDGDNDHACDFCGVTIIETNLILNVGENFVYLIAEQTEHAKFIPSESGKYFFKSDSNFDPAIKVYDSNFNYIAFNDDADGYNFYIELDLVAGETYYLGLYEITSESNECTVIINKVCDDHIFDQYDFDREGHSKVCSACGIADNIIFAHEYNEDGLCECGRERVYGVYFGSTLLLDGQYIDNDGNVSQAKPEGGYAHYSGGVLTFNDFEFSFEGYNSLNEADAIYAETDLTIILKGKSTITAKGGDAIASTGGDVTIDGDGTLVLNTERFDDLSGDGIDVDLGDLTINGGNFIIYASNDGIECDLGEVTINGGSFLINAEDDGMEVDDIVINGGTFYIESDEDDGIDAGDVTIGGGTIVIDYCYETGIDSTGVITVLGGDISIDSESACLYADEGILIEGGSFYLYSHSNNPAIYSYEYLTFGENVDDFNVVIYEDGYTVADDEDNFFTSLIITDRDVTKDIFESDLEYNDDLYYNGNTQFPEIEVYDVNGDPLTLGVDFEVVPLFGEAKEPGMYLALVRGIGDYSGYTVIEYTIHECDEASLDGDLEIEVSGISGKVYSFVKFVPRVDATYRFVFDATSYINVDFYHMDDYMQNYYDDGGYVVIELELLAGEEYYFDVYDENLDSSCLVSVEVVCDEHRGGTATYHDLAVCEVCGESYGELPRCPGHFGGEATYHDRAVCVECGFEYGELLVCDHMCHKGSYYTIIWHIFESIYKYLGIEQECECGEAHY